MAFLSLVVMLGLLVVIYRTWSRWPLDLIGLFCATFMWFYGLRATVITFGLDDLFPDYLFDQANSPVAQTNLLLALFLLGVIVGLALGATASVRLGWLIPRVVREPTPRRYQQVAAVLTALAVVLLAVQVLRYADFGGLLRATKVDKETQGTFLLRIVPAMGAVVSMAWFSSALKAGAPDGRPLRRRWRWRRPWRSSTGCATSRLAAAPCSCSSRSAWWSVASSSAGRRTRGTARSHRRSWLPRC